MNNSKVPSISIEGHATVAAKADIGFVDLYSRADGMLLEDAVAESTNRVDKIIGGIRSSKLDIKDIEVADIQIGERKPLMTASKETPKPEVIKNILVVIPPSLEIAIRIVDIASRLGASLQSPLGNMFASGVAGSAILFGLLNSSESEEAAIKAAIEDAHALAARTAKLLGKSIGRVLEITKIETAGTAMRGPQPHKKAKDSRFLTNYLSLTPGKVEVAATLTIVFELLG